MSTAEPRPWASRDLSSEELARIQTLAKTIDDKHFQDISQYLQHCTERRFEEGKFWNYSEMFAELQPSIQAFLRLFPVRIQGGTTVPTLGNENSTATVTYLEWNPGEGR